MLDFNTNYEYENNPISSVGGYKILSMSDNGYKKYFAKDSYNYNFLGKTNRNIFMDKLKFDDEVKQRMKYQNNRSIGQSLQKEEGLVTEPDLECGVIDDKESINKRYIEIFIC